ncbi:MAG: hypothetical protein BJBARM5_0036 [Candidatus Parvarchaeum acidophilus ARMAN-5]|jgi:hypothetical protein|uniref:SprT-like domain-containing protein n=1 Tax=Candidatus Parvarchaeum acidophilus ARMAN-5 TaxID=662762 RepID=D6GUB1_PARA5|nr:MAG: hypothetical protein BJBARM5_0036 [Candidatus Parvarchaeum acidophilus ARMAN-5]
MINEKYFDIKYQRNLLDAILSSMRKKMPEKENVFLPEKYHITIARGKVSDFNGKYNRKDDSIEIDKMFIYDKLSSFDIYDIRNTVIHEEAHRQVFLNDKTDDFADHWESWLKEYLSMGGKPPEVYTKVKYSEVSKEYSEIKPADLESIIIITDDGKDTTRKLIYEREAVKRPFLTVYKDGKIKRNNFQY